MLNVVSFEDAKRIIEEKLTSSVGNEVVGLDKAVGRVTDTDIVSRENIPSFDRSTVDGYAVKAADTYGSGESIPSFLEIKREVLMGESAEFSIESGECAKISTGGMLPAGADAVVMVENTDCENNELCLVFKAVSPFENVTKLGDDAKANETVIPAGTTLKPRHIGVLAAMGYNEVPVRKKVSVGIISTGDEVVEITESPAEGQIRDVNSHLLCSVVEDIGASAVKFGIVKDNYERIYETVKAAGEQCDVVIISGGSSAGTRDMTVDIISKLGEVYAHGIAMKPGKPTIIGKIGGKPVFGLPGHPAAAFFVAQTLVVPMLKRMAGDASELPVVSVPVKSNISSNHGREEFLCVKTEDGFAVPVYSKSGIVSMLNKADGYIVIGRNTEGIKMGESVDVHLF